MVTRSLLIGSGRDAHGRPTEVVVRRVATVQKRRLLRQIGLRANEIDGIGQAYLDGWARAQAKVEIMDSWAAGRGWLDEQGRPPGFHDHYFAALNSARLSMNALSQHLKARKPGVVIDLTGYAPERSRR